MASVTTIDKAPRVTTNKYVRLQLWEPSLSGTNGVYGSYGYPPHKDLTAAEAKELGEQLIAAADELGG